MRLRPYRGDVGDLAEQNDAFRLPPLIEDRLRNRCGVGDVGRAGKQQPERKAALRQQVMRFNEDLDALVVEEPSDEADGEWRSRLRQRQQQVDIDSRARNERDLLGAHAELFGRIAVVWILDEHYRAGPAEQEAEQIEQPLVGREHHRGGDEAPADHDARHPDARADARQDDVRRHLEQRVADEEDRCAEGVGGVAVAGIGLIGLAREADVGAVEEGQHVHQQQEGDQSRVDLAVKAGRVG